MAAVGSSRRDDEVIAYLLVGLPAEYDQLFWILARFGVFLHNYALCSFISKNRPQPRRHHHWRRGNA
jgi:hypothetical protein